MLLTVSNQWISQFVVVYAVPYMIKGIKYGIFFFFGACILASGVTVFFFYPETKGFKLEEMHLIWNGSIWARKARAEGERLREELQNATDGLDSKAVEAEQGDAEHTESSSPQTRLDV